MILTLLPCVDNQIEPCCNHTEFSKQDPNTHSTDLDMCSPFCTCNCCHVNTIVSKLVVIQPKSTLPEIISCDMHITQLQEIPIAIWQPPKIQSA